MISQSAADPSISLRLFMASQMPMEVPDHDLLERFLAQHDETAFAALVHRHSTMVLNVCRRILRHAHDAEDACQATFLILAHKAASIRKRDALGSWLHGVALSVARRLRARLARQVAKPLTERDDVARADEPETLSWAEVRAALDEELHRLPESYRAPMVLCYLEGRTRDEAALQLGWSMPTLHGRLERGRVLLHARLVRRGLTLSAALIATTLATEHAAATVHASLLIQILRSVASHGDGATAVSPQVASLVNGVLTTMIQTKKKYILSLVCVAAVAAGSYAAYHFYGEPMPEAQTTALAPHEPSVEDTKPTPGPAPKETKAEETIELSGKVLDSDGRPCEGAELFLVAMHDSPLNNGLPPLKSGADGRFTLAVPKAELLRHLATVRPVNLVATAKGFGMAWHPAASFLPKDEWDKVNLLTRLFTSDHLDRNNVLKLSKGDIPLSGRIETPEGKPISGATVYLEQVYANDNNDLTAWHAACDRKEDFGKIWQHLPRELAGDRLKRLAVTTDKEGRFQLTGIGANRVVSLSLSGPGVAAATILARTERGARLDLNLSNFAPDPHGCFGADFTLSAAPSRPIVGVVRDADTGRPIPGAVVQSNQFAGREMIGLMYLRTQADANGHYRLDGMPVGKGNKVIARGPSDQPYLATNVDVDSSSGNGPVELDLKIKRGLWAEGQVTDAATGQPLAADIHYYCLTESNPHFADAPGFVGIMQYGYYQTDATGRYRIPVLPGRGVVAAQLHGQRTYFLKKATTWQAGKTYSDYQGKFDQTDAINDGTLVKAVPTLFFVGNYHQMAVIDAASNATALKCDLPVNADGSPLKTNAKNEKEVKK